MDYVITYEFPIGVEQKYKSNIGAILKRRYEDKGYMLRMGKGKLYIDFKRHCDEIVEKLIKNKAKIIKIEEVDERPNFYDNYISKRIEKKVDQTKKKIEVPKKKDKEIIKEIKEGFNILYGFFEWVKENNKALLKNPRMYRDRLEKLDLELIDKIHKGA